MMTIILSDKKTCTHARCKHVIQLNTIYVSTRGKGALAYELLFADDEEPRIFKKCRYDIERIELEVIL